MDNGTDQLTLDYQTDQSGTADITIRAEDSGGLMVDDVFTVTVNNLAPVFNSLSTASFAENGTGTVLDVNADNGGDGADDSGVTYSFGGGADDGDFNLDSSTGALSFKSAPDFENPTDSDGQNDYVVQVTADDGETSNNTTTQTITVTVTDVNDAPTISAISDETISEDNTLSPVAFTVGDAETAASGLTVTASSDNQTLVPDANITLGGSGANRTVEITPASDANGTATITVTVDDGAASNNTASASFTLTVTAVPDVALTDGRNGASYNPPSAAPGTDDNPVGRLQLGTDQDATLSEVTITNYAPTPTGVTAITLWTSADDSFDGIGTDTEVASIGYDDSATFSSLSVTIPTSGIYVFVTVDLAADAGGNYEPAIMSASAISFTSGGLSSVNGTAGSTFSDAYLSSGNAALPVELTAFNAQTNPSDAVVLTWQTASETNNAGFEVQRRTGSGGAFESIGFQAGAGTTAAPRSYRFTDAHVPYAADSLVYRLKQLDADGSAAYSRAVTVARSGANAVELPSPYPNPAHRQATVRFAVPDEAKGAARLELFDLLGRRVQTVRITAGGRQETQLDLRGLSSGLYFLRLTADRQVRTQRLTVVR